MALSVYDSSVPVYERSLNAFLAILDRAEEHAQARKFDPDSYLAMRLSPAWKNRSYRLYICGTCAIAVTPPV